MNASELIKKLQALVKEFGDLPVRGDILDGQEIDKIEVYDKNGCNAEQPDIGEPFEIFMFGESRC